MSLLKINQLPIAEAIDHFKKCCGSTAWATQMTAARPFSTLNEMEATADRIWFSLGKQDWREAFSHHPRIGEDLDVLREKFKSTAKWSGDEQSGVNSASEETLKALQQGNRDYEAKFQHVFLVCATGKTAAEMLALLHERIHHNADEELKIAAQEQSKITKIRLKKWIES